MKTSQTFLIYLYYNKGVGKSDTLKTRLLHNLINLCQNLLAYPGIFPLK